MQAARDFGESLHHRALLWSQSASEAYADITFMSPGDFYNKEAPDPLYAWSIGCAMAVITAFFWYWKRWLPTKASIGKQSQTLSLRIIMSSLADNDNPTFSILRVSTQSMLLLACFQLDYTLTLTVMLGYYAVISTNDSLRVLLALREADSLQDLVVVSKRDRRFLMPNVDLAASQGKQGVVASIDLKSQNVYEDISRAWSVVLLVFVTQSALISFVVFDAYKLGTHSAPDSTKDVPIVGTMGSYLIYMLGILMQCVYLLGPKSSFGNSEQNPHFWIQLLLSAKKSGCRCTWTTEGDGVKHERILRPSDGHLWVRFAMSFLVNGVFYHILVHALPIQLAAQPSLTAVVGRAFGQLALVDLDDAPGTMMKLVEYQDNEGTEAEDEVKKPHGHDSDLEVMPTNTAQSFSSAELKNGHVDVPNKTPEELIERARLQADLLKRQLREDLNALAADAEAKTQQVDADGAYESKKKEVGYFVFNEDGHE